MLRVNFHSISAIEIESQCVFMAHYIIACMVYALSRYRIVMNIRIGARRFRSLLFSFHFSSSSKLTFVHKRFNMINSVGPNNLNTTTKNIEDKFRNGIGLMCSRSRAKWIQITIFTFHSKRQLKNAAVFSVSDHSINHFN